MPWKLYVDSRRRVPGARGDSDSDFAIAMPYPIVVSGKCYLDVVLLSNSFYTIRTGNDRIYLDELAAQTKRLVTIAHGQYTVYELRDALIDALNNNKAITGQYAVSYVDAANRFHISLANSVVTDQYRIWSDASLKANMSAWSAITTLSANDLQSANRPCGFAGGSFVSGAHTTTAAVAPHAPDVQPYKQLFIRSSLAGGSNESLGINGETDIVRRIVVGNTPINGMIHDVHNQAFDCITINGRPEISQMWFEVIDVDGRVVDTHGLPVSFSILFQDLDE
jgi:hypothetical protein